MLSCYSTTTTTTTRNGTMKLRSSTRKRHSEETPIIKTKQGKRRGNKEAGEDKKKDQSDDVLDVKENAAMPMPMAIDSPVFSTNASPGSNDDTKSLDPASDDEEEMELILELCMADERVVKTLEYAEPQDEEQKQTIRPSFKPILVRTKTSTTHSPCAMIGRRHEDENSPITINNNNKTPAKDYVKNNKLGMEEQTDSSIQNNDNITTQEDRLLADFLSSAAAYEFPPLDHEDVDEEEPELESHSNNKYNYYNNGNTSSPTFSPAFHPAFHHCLPESTAAVGAHEHSAFAAFTRPPPPPSPLHVANTIIATTTTTTVCACQHCEEFWTDHRKANHILFKHKKLLDESANDALYGWCENGQSFDLLDHPQTNAILAEIMGKDSETKALTRFRGRLYNFGFIKNFVYKGRTNFSHPLFRRDSTDHELIFLIEQKRTKSVMGASLHANHCPVRQLLTPKKPPRHDQHDSRREQDDDAAPAAPGTSSAGRSRSRSRNHELHGAASPISLSAFTSDLRSNGRNSRMDAMIAEIIFEVFRPPRINDDNNAAATATGRPDGSSTTSSFAMTMTSTDSTTETNAN